MEPPSTHISILQDIKDPKKRKESLERCLDHYRETILNWCKARGLQEADAEEVTQQVLIELSNILPKFDYDPAKSFRGWLKTFVNRRTIDFRRKEERRRDQPKGGTTAQKFFAQQEAKALDELADSLSSISDPQLEAAMEQVRKRVNDNTWAVFYRLAIKKHSPADVAKEFGMTITGVLGARNRVRKYLRKAYDDLEST